MTAHVINHQHNAVVKNSGNLDTKLGTHGHSPFSHPTALSIGQNNLMDFYTWLENHPTQAAPPSLYGGAARVSALLTRRDPLRGRLRPLNDSGNSILVDIGGGNG